MTGRLVPLARHYRGLNFHHYWLSDNWIGVLRRLTAIVALAFYGAVNGFESAFVFAVSHWEG